MRLSQETENALIDLVRTVAQAEIMPKFRNLPGSAIRAKSSAIDLVTDADLAAEAAISKGVEAILPGAVIIGEEAVSADREVLRDLAEAEMAVIIDPIDGTWNFANGLAVFGVILAVAVRGETVFGLLYDPVMDDWVQASKGGGAWFASPKGEAERLQVAPARPLADASGFITHYLFPKVDQPRLAQGMLKANRVSALCCSCHDYRLLTQGKVDFVQAVGLNAWDHAAGVLAVTEAGGFAQMADGTPYAPGLTEGLLTSASSPALYDEVVIALGIKSDLSLSPQKS